MQGEFYCPNTSSKLKLFDIVRSLCTCPPLHSGLAQSENAFEDQPFPLCFAAFSPCLLEVFDLKGTGMRGAQLYNRSCTHALSNDSARDVSFRALELLAAEAP